MLDAPTDTDTPRQETMMNTRQIAAQMATPSTPADHAASALTEQELACLSGGIQEVDPVRPGTGNFNPQPDPPG